MSANPWFRFFPSDWLAGVAGLSAAERGVYITLLAIMYDHGGAIPRDDARLSRQCGIPKAGFARALDSLISTGKIVVENGCLFNSRAKTELTERENKSSAASASANSRWQKTKTNQPSSNASACASALPTQCENDAPEMLTTTTSTDTTTVVSKNFGQTEKARDAAFDRFWNVWPNKVAKPDARKAFAKVWREIDVIIPGVEIYIINKPADRDWMHPATFLNGRRWEDKPAQPSARAGPSAPQAKYSHYTQGLLDAVDAIETRNREASEPSEPDALGSGGRVVGWA